MSVIQNIPLEWTTDTHNNVDKYLNMLMKEVKSKVHIILCYDSIYIKL